MSAALSKLTMCVCAGTIGAVSVPIAHKAQSALHPHKAKTHQLAATPAKAAPCAPAYSVAALPALAPAVAPQRLLLPVNDDVAMLVPVRVGAGGNGGWSIGSGGGGGFPGGGGGLPGGGGGVPSNGGGGGIIVPPSSITPPGPVTPTGAVPEPAIWTQMVIGFGLVGAAVRARLGVQNHA